MIEAVKLIVKRLHQLLNIPVIPNDMTVKKPPYPYATYKIITPMIPAQGQPNVKREVIEKAPPEGTPTGDDLFFMYDIKETMTDQPTFTVSFSAYQTSEFAAIELVQEMLNTLKNTLYYELKDINAVMVKHTPISDRTLFIADHYEFRYGFDVTIRITNTVTRRVEIIEELNMKMEE